MRTHLTTITAIAATSFILTACGSSDSSSQPTLESQIESAERGSLSVVDGAEEDSDGYLDYVTPDAEGPTDSWNPPVVEPDSKVKFARGQYFFTQDVDSLSLRAIESDVNILDETVVVAAQQGPGSLVMFQAAKPGETTVDIAWFEVSLDESTGEVVREKVGETLLDIKVVSAPEGKVPHLRTYIGHDPEQAHPGSIRY